MSDRPDALALLNARRQLRTEALAIGAKSRAHTARSRADRQNAEAFARLSRAAQAGQTPTRTGADSPLALPSRHEARGRTARYWTVTGAPPQCGPDDRVAARAFHRKCVAAIELGGWGPKERPALHVLAKVWHARAYGNDVRFIYAGTARGRLDPSLEYAIHEERKARATAALAAFPKRRRKL